MTEDQFLSHLQRSVNRAGGAPNWCKLHGLTPSAVYQVLNKVRPIMPAIVEALNFRKEVKYVSNKRRDGYAPR